MKTILVAVLLLTSTLAFSATSNISSVETCGFWNEFFGQGELAPDVANGTVACLCGMGNSGKLVLLGFYQFLSSPIETSQNIWNTIQDPLPLIEAIKADIRDRIKIYGSLTAPEQSAMVCESIVDAATLGITATKIAQLGIKGARLAARAALRKGVPEAPLAPTAQSLAPHSRPAPYISEPPGVEEPFVPNRFFEVSGPVPVKPAVAVAAVPVAEASQITKMVPPPQVPPIPEIPVDIPPPPRPANPAPLLETEASSGQSLPGGLAIEGRKRFAGIYLIKPSELPLIPDRTELRAITGANVIKGVDHIDTRTYGGYLGYGIYIP